MTLIASRKPKSYEWNSGDLIGAKEASELLGYKSPRNFQDEKRLAHIAKDFEAAGCKFTTNIFITGGNRRFLRSEIDAYLSRVVENARESQAVFV